MKKTRFWKVYTIAAAAAAVFLFAGLVVFYAFIASYEKAQPEYTARQYADTLTDDAVSKWKWDTKPDAVSPYETVEAIRSQYLAALVSISGTYSVRKDFTQYTAENPVFLILKGDTEIGSLVLSPGGKGTFGMDRWSVSDASADLSPLIRQKEYLVYVPTGASLTVNGQPGRQEDRTQTDIPYKYASRYEANTTRGWELYKISGLCAEPILSCQLNGEECPAESAENNSMYFRFPPTSLHTFTVTVPENASVTVNGIPADKADAAPDRIPYEYVSAEASLENLPSAVRYTFSGLFSRPEIAGMMGEIPLSFEAAGNSWTASYPDELKYSAEIRVPAGASVTMHGTDCSAFYTHTEDAFPSLSKHISQMPKFDVYTVRGLYLSPENSVKATLNGTDLPLSQTLTSFDAVITAKFPESEHQAVEDLAMAFTKSYIHYTGQGFNNTDRNLADVLSYVIPKTDTYTRIEKSRIAFIYVTPVLSSKYKTLDVSAVTCYSDTLYECTVAFDVQQNTYGHLRDYAGSFQLVIAQVNGVWKIADMQIITK